jgi:hypothetical protein
MDPAANLDKGQNAQTEVNPFIQVQHRANPQEV